jgi:hypothetical protein
VEADAVDAYLAISPEPIHAAKDLLGDPSIPRVAAITSFALAKYGRELWPVMKPLLWHGDEHIRRVACYHAITVSKRPELLKLLDEYLKQTPYFYNVVTLLDRALYAPAIARRRFAEEERQFFIERRGDAA